MYNSAATPSLDVAVALLLNFPTRKDSYLCQVHHSNSKEYNVYSKQLIAAQMMYCHAFLKEIFLLRMKEPFKGGKKHIPCWADLPFSATIFRKLPILCNLPGVHDPEVPLVCEIMYA